MELSIVKPGNAEAGTVSVSDAAFAREYNEDLVHQVVTAHLAGARQGTRAQKNRADVRGGGKKPWRQKGTGRARHGSTRSPIWVGGGVAFGPRKEKKYSRKNPKKMKKKALAVALSAKVKNKQIILIKDLNLEMAKTRILNKIIENLKAILASKEMQKQIIKEELLEVKEKFYDKRRTEIIYSSAEFNPEDFYADDEVVITINPVNDPPILNIIGTFEADEDQLSQTYDFSSFCSQVWGETDLLTLTAINSNHIDVTITDFDVVFESNTQDWYGTEDITFFLDDNVSDSRSSNYKSDGYSNRNQISANTSDYSRDIVNQTISVTINPVNDPPILNITISPETPLVNQTVTIDASQSHHQDPNGTITLS